MSSGKRIGELVEVPPIRTVIRLEEGKEKSSEIAESFVFTPEVAAHLDVLGEAVAAGRGQGYFLQGDFGSGKSHFLAMLYTWISGRTGSEVLRAGHSGLEKASAAVRSVLPVAVSLVDYRSETSLESILLGAMERALKDAGHAVSLSPYSGFLDWLAGILSDPENAQAFSRIVKAPEEDLTGWVAENPEKAYAGGLRLAHEKALAAPSHLVEQRRANFLRVFSQLASCGFQGIFLMIDELSEFFRSKPSVPDLNEDARTLQLLGEMTGEAKLWIVAAVQESVEKTGDIAQGTRRKIKDRFPIRLALSKVHIHSLMAHRLVRKRPGAEEEILKIYEGYRRQHASFRYAFDEFLQVYPVHPATIALLEGLSDLFSQHRGIVDFVCSRIAGDRRRHIPSVLERPAEELLGPDSIYDHFSERLAEVSAYNAYARHIIPHMDQTVEKVIEDQEDRYTAKRLVRMLVLYRIHPTADVPDVSMLAELAACSLDAPEMNVRYVAEVLLDPLAAASRFLTKRTGRGPGQAVYEISTEEDPGKVLDARIRRISEELAADDSRLLVESLLRAPESDSWPGSMILRESLLREVGWYMSQRRVLIRFLHREDIDPAGLAREIASKDADFAVVFTVGEAAGTSREPAFHSKAQAAGTSKDAAPIEGAGIDAAAIWRVPLPRQGEGLEQLREFLSTLLAADELSPSNPAQAPLIPLAGERVERLKPGAVQAALGALYAGRFDDPRIQVEAAVRQLRRFDRLLEAAGEVVLADRYPRFPEVAPRRYPASPRMYQQLLETFVVPGSLPLREARGLGPAIEGLAMPLGLVELKRGSYLFSPDASRHPLIAFLFSLLSPSGAVAATDVLDRLTKGSFGLPRDTAVFLLASLASGGLITLRRGGRAVSLELLSLQSLEKADEIALGELIGEEAKDILLTECGFLGEVGRWESFGLKQQREAWSEVIKFRTAAERLAGDILDRLRQREGYTSFRGFRFAPLKQKLEAVGKVASEIRVSYAAKEGLEKFVAAWRASGLSAEDVLLLQKLGRFLLRAAEKLVFVSHYMSHRSTDRICETDDEMAGLRREILDLLENPEERIVPDEGAELDELFGAYREKHVARYLRLHQEYYEAAKPPALSKNAERALAVLKRLAGVEALDRPAGLDRFLTGMSASREGTCTRPVREELMRGPICSCGFLPGQAPPAPETSDPEADIDRYLTEYLRILKEPAVLESLSGHAYALQDVNPSLAERLKGIGSNLGSGAMSASTLVKTFDEGAVQEIAGALSGKVTLRRIRLGELIRKLSGRRLSAERIQALVSEWLGEPEEGVLMAVDTLSGTDQAAASGGAQAAAPGGDTSWWALLNTDLFDLLPAGEDQRDSMGRKVEAMLEAAYPSPNLAESFRSMDQTELTGFIRSEAFHTGAIREAWKALIPSVLKGGRPYNPSQTASGHIVAERAREITDRLSTASEIPLRSEMPFPGRLGVRVYLDKVLADPWTDDAVRNAVFDSLQKIEALGKSWLEGLGAVEPIELAGGPLVLVVDAVSPDVWLEAAGQMDLLQMDSPKKEEHVKERDLLSKVPGKCSTGWARLEAVPETAPATARLFGFQADPFDEFASRGISYIHFRGTEGRPLPDLLEPFTPGSAVVVRLSLLDQAAHTGTSRLGGMIVRLRELLARELPPLAALCGEQKRPLILTTDHGLSLGRDGLKHGAGGVYERAIFRAQWNS